MPKNAKINFVCNCAKSATQLVESNTKAIIQIYISVVKVPKWRQNLKTTPFEEVFLNKIADTLEYIHIRGYF